MKLLVRYTRADGRKCRRTFRNMDSAIAFCVWAATGTRKPCYVEVRSDDGKYIDDAIWIRKEGNDVMPMYAINRNDDVINDYNRDQRLDRMKKMRATQMANEFTAAVRGLND